MRDVEVIDSELRLLLAIRNMVREAEGRAPSTARIDELLGTTRNPDQNLKHRGRRAAAGWHCDLFTPLAPEDKRPDN